MDRAAFTDEVRQQFFDGLRGDPAALDRAMTMCERTLAAHPDQPIALVWHGAGLIVRSRVPFAAGDRAAGLALYQRGIGEMERAVALAPNDVAVRIPRGAVLLAVAPFVPEPERTRLLRAGTGDYEATLGLQAERFAGLTLHSREQLLYGLTDGYASLGDLDKARGFYDRMARDAAGSALLSRAETRAAGGQVAGPTPCEQCHAR